MSDRWGCILLGTQTPGTKTQRAVTAEPLCRFPLINQQREQLGISLMSEQFVPGRLRRHWASEQVCRQQMVGHFMKSIEGVSLKNIYIYIEKQHFREAYVCGGPTWPEPLSRGAGLHLGQHFQTADPLGWVFSVYINKYMFIYLI